MEQGQVDASVNERDQVAVGETTAGLPLSESSASAAPTGSPTLLERLTPAWPFLVVAGYVGGLAAGYRLLPAAGLAVGLVLLIVAVAGYVLLRPRKRPTAAAAAAGRADALPLTEGSAAGEGAATAPRERARAGWAVWAPWLLFGGALLVYAITRFVALPQFPIYFFTDEAIHPVLGTELIARGFRDAQGRLFPPYFQNGQYWNLSLSV
ncbi:MAG: hypothetical protein U0641_16190, partial [Anaerolineae bacterium]